MKGINIKINGGLKLAVMPTKKPLAKLFNLDILLSKSQAIEINKA